ncbi:MAG: hypothetical protein IJM81_09685 [Prevotella sp.]|nr:hypothetical protein [Prevotella sp.]
MKRIQYFLMALLCTMFVTSCMDGENNFFDLDGNEWTDPNFPEGSPYGNNNITEDNIITIAQLKTKYSSAFSGSACVEVKDDVKIKAYVTGNDIGGNIYKQVAVQDATGAIIIGINKAGLCGYLAEGQQIIIDLKGLYVGAYGSQPQIGAPYNGGIGRMAESIWMQHFKLVGDIDADAIQPVDFNSVKGDIAANCGKLVVLKNVTFKNADGTKTLIDGNSSGSNYYAQDIDGLSNTIVRTSSYADFAAMVMPFDLSTGQKKACNIVGIASRYSNTWQIMIRKTSDITVIE